MAMRSIPAWFGIIILVVLGLAACAPPSNLPVGFTPIPTLMPVTEEPALQPTAVPTSSVLSYPARLPSAAEGQTIYLTYCAECHGEDGVGVVPNARNFRDLDYMRAETPTDFYVAVTEGRGEMPAYTDDLDSDQRWDVVFYVWRLSTSVDALDLGQTIYTQNCGACHGEAGSGELLGSAEFNDLRTMADLAPRDLYLTVTQGRGSMPAWQSLLSQDERWAVIDYIRSFTYDPSVSEAVGSAPAVEPQPTQAGVTAACSPDQTNPFAWEDLEAIQAGEAIYQAQCALCHGPDGRGLLPGTPDFTSPEVHAELIQDAGVSFCILAEGKNAMPSYEETLTSEERWQVLTFLGSIGP